MYASRLFASVQTVCTHIAQYRGYRDVLPVPRVWVALLKLIRANLFDYNARGLGDVNAKMVLARDFARVTIRAILVIK
jgi:hypothetical protein